jgi:two-component system chemotaxis sensor kinase CheA
VSRQLGKKVRLVLEGESAEADKHIVESLGDPLIHILRNSLDHGLEPPDVRRAAGKPEEGRILVRASQEGDRVSIEIEDDGRGIDPVLVKRKAFEKGLVDEARLDTLSDAEAIQFIFAPGFSTAETVSNLSGRGVGMDVVNSSLQKIGGNIRLTSEKGRGTRIVLTLPLSVSVSNVLMVTMDGQRYGVPMDMVVETVRVPREDIHVIKDRRVAVLRGRVVPLFGADQLLQLPQGPVANGEDEFAVLVVRVDGAVVGLIVDGFAQTTDVILKPLEGPLGSLAGFLGSALLGDGSVLLVLDLKELMYAS